MYKLLLPVNKGKTKTKIRGFWRDNNITYYDYLKIQCLPYVNNKALKGIGQSYNELALFYIGNKCGYIYTCKSGKTEELKQVKRINHIGYKGLKKAIKGFITNYGGVTVYNKGKYYLLECFYND